MRIGLNFAKCNHKEELFLRLKDALNKEMPQIKFKDNKNYETFGLVVNIDELMQASEIITRMLGKENS